MSCGEKENRCLIVTVDCAGDVPAVSLCSYQTGCGCCRKLQIGSWILPSAVREKHSYAKGLIRFTESEETAEALLTICRSSRELLEEFADLPGLESLPLCELPGLEADLSKEAGNISLTDLRQVYDSTAGAVLEDALKAVQERIDVLTQESAESRVLICVSNEKESAVGFLIKLQLERFFGLSSRDDRRISQKELETQISKWEYGKESYDGCPFSVIWRETEGMELVKNVKVGEAQVDGQGIEFDPRLSWELILKPEREEREFPLRRLMERRGFLNWWKGRSHWSYPNMTLYAEHEKDGSLRLQFMLEGLFEEDVAEYKLTLKPEEYLYPELV